MEGRYGKNGLNSPNSPGDTKWESERHVPPGTFSEYDRLLVQKGKEHDRAYSATVRRVGR